MPPELLHDYALLVHAAALVLMPFVGLLLTHLVRQKQAPGGD